MTLNSGNWNQALDHAVVSDIGMRRANNQDSYSVQLASDRTLWHRRGHLFTVADGMGAHVAGEMASKLAADNICLSYLKYADLAPAVALFKAINDANDLIHRRGQSSEDFKGMGTTSTTLVVMPQHAIVGHVGDSRAYRLRGLHFDQLTFDHSLIWEMRAAGQLTDDQAINFVPKNIITRSLGPNPSVQVDLEGPFPLQPGDTFLLCSDGLSGLVEDPEIGAILYCLPPKKAVRVLADLANLRGGPDNITAIAVRVSDQQALDAAPAETSDAAAAPAHQPVHPLIWTLLGALTLASLALGLLSQWVPAAASLLGAFATGIAALVQRSRKVAQGPGALSGPLGRGPYTRCDCTPNVALVDRLAQVVQELDEAAKDGQWKIDWAPFQQFRQRGAAAKKAGNLPQAVREQCDAISFMMEQLRHAGGHSPNDSRVVP